MFVAYRVRSTDCIFSMYKSFEKADQWSTIDHWIIEYSDTTQILGILYDRKWAKCKCSTIEIQMSFHNKFLLPYHKYH